MAAIPAVTMLDTIGADYANIPTGTAKVAGYVTGTPDIIWPPQAWDRFPRAGKVRVDQSEQGDLYAAGEADVYDMEAYAGTPARFAQIAAARHARGLLNCGYGSRISLQQAANYLAALPMPEEGWWRGSVSCWLADPDLSLGEASVLIGQVLFGGLACVAVQWATPASNPGTVVGTGTLESLNLDMSIARAGWIPGKPDPDAWQMQALLKARQLATAATSLADLLEANL
jgi:hypothetical protein